MFDYTKIAAGHRVSHSISLLVIGLLLYAGAAGYYIVTAVLRHSLGAHIDTGDTYIIQALYKYLPILPGWLGVLCVLWAMKGLRGPSLRSPLALMGSSYAVLLVNQLALYRELNLNISNILVTTALFVGAMTGWAALFHLRRLIKGLPALELTFWMRLHLLLCILILIPISYLYLSFIPIRENHWLLLAALIFITLMVSTIIIYIRQLYREYPDICSNLVRQRPSESKTYDLS
ncbi:MAG: hypothetical protein K0U66_08145 [Gammaproteobacteria bacterium]|nr:hypothetical protein [Gammaproteobacteria bacterium]